MEISPIAIYHGPLGSKFGLPRQSGLAEKLQGTIVFEPGYRDANSVRGLEEFDFLWLLWGFSACPKTESWSPTVRPPRLGGNKQIGVFASRSPFRPNGLGLSSVRLERITEGPVIHVLGADLMDGTPIYDIKPYLRYCDSHPDARSGFTDVRQWQPLEVVFPPEIQKKLSEEESEALREILSQDPRPQYQHDPDRVYGMPYSGHDIKFRVRGKVLEVVGII